MTKFILNKNIKFVQILYVRHKVLKQHVASNVTFYQYVT